MATEEWVKLCPCPDEIEMVSAMATEQGSELKDAESVIQAIRDLPIHKIKDLFQKHLAPRKVQEDCYRHCLILVKDWSDAAGDKWS